MHENQIDEASVTSGALMTVRSGGLAKLTTVFSSGSMTIGAGGVASSTYLSSGGRLTVGSGGVEVHGMIAGNEVVAAGGVTSAAQVSGVQTLQGGDSFGTMLVGPLQGNVILAVKVFQRVSSGSVAEGTVVSNVAEQLILSGGVSIDTVLLLKSRPGNRSMAFELRHSGELARRRISLARRYCRRNARSQRWSS